MKYFAYGSNLKKEDLSDWCNKRNMSVPDLSNPVPFCLDDYRLGFTRNSIRRKGGVADIIYSQGDHCWGVVFDVTNDALGVLDEKEGIDCGAYKQLELTNDMITYDVVNKKDFVKPHPDYVNLIIEGARHYGLPKDWIKMLESYRD